MYKYNNKTVRESAVSTRGVGGGVENLKNLSF